MTFFWIMGILQFVINEALWDIWNLSSFNHNILLKRAITRSRTQHQQLFLALSTFLILRWLRLAENSPVLYHTGVVGWWKVCSNITFAGAEIVLSLDQQCPCALTVKPEKILQHPLKKGPSLLLIMREGRCAKSQRGCRGVTDISRGGDWEMSEVLEFSRIKRPNGCRGEWDEY